MPLFSPEQTAVGALLLFRVSALVWSAPLFSGRAVPRQLKVGILVILTVLLYPAALTSYAEGIQVNPSTVLGELTVGLLTGPMRVARAR